MMALLLVDLNGIFCTGSIFFNDVLNDPALVRYLICCSYVSLESFW